MRRLVASAAFTLGLLAACGPASEADTGASPDGAARGGIDGESLKALDAARAVEDQAETDSRRLRKAIDDAGG